MGITIYLAVSLLELSIRQQEAELSQKHRAMQYVSSNLVNCCAGVQKVIFEKDGSKRNTLQVTCYAS